MIQFNYVFDPETRQLTPSGDPVNVKNDVNVVQIVFTIPQTYGGISLIGLTWRVYYKTAMNTKKEEMKFHILENPVASGNVFTLKWTLSAAVAEYAGQVGFALSGSSATNGTVTTRINSLAAYEKIEPTIGGGSYTEDDADIDGIKDFLLQIQEAAEAAAESAAEAAAAAAESAAEALQISQEFDGLLAYKNLAIIESATGDPAVIADGADRVPMKSLVASIEPRQDLHGYDKPWVGGAGKNLLQVTATTQTINGITFTVNSDGSVNVNGTATGNITYYLYTLNNNRLTISNGNYVLSDSVESGDSASRHMFCSIYRNGTYNRQATSYGTNEVAISDGETIGVGLYITRGTAVSNIIFKPMIRLASESDSTFAPYQNICPITGWDEIKVTRVGKNLVDLTGLGNSTISGITFTVNPSAGTVTANGTATGNAILGSVDTDITGVRTFTISGNPTGASASTYRMRVEYFDANKTGIGNWSYFNGERSVYTVPSDPSIKYLRIQFYVVNGQTLSNVVYKPMVQVGDQTDISFEPYSGQTYSVALTSAGTVYGGTLDVVSGKLVVDRARVDMGSLTWAKMSSAQGYSVVRFGKYLGKVLSSAYHGVQTSAIASAWNDGDIGIGNSASLPVLYCIDFTKYASMTANEFMTAVTGQTLVYELSTPTEYQLTPTQVTTLLRNNSVWADCGSVALEYAVDTKTYIDSLIGG